MRIITLIRLFPVRKCSLFREYKMMTVIYYKTIFKPLLTAFSSKIGDTFTLTVTLSAPRVININLLLKAINTQSRKKVFRI